MLKKTNSYIRMMLSVTLVVMIITLGSPAGAGLTAVSGLPDPADDEVPPLGNPAQVAISLANGFPIWYGDDGGLKLELCLDRPVTVAPGVSAIPCEVELPFSAAPPSFPVNFGAEALYWTAVTAGTFASSNGATNIALLVLTQQAGFAAEGPVADGSQAVFSRIRIRVDLPVAGTYRVTHPFGARDYAVTTPGLRAINQTQDKGGLIALDFLTSMSDGPPPVPPLDPAISTGAVNADGATIGPFLVPGNNHGGVFDPNNAATFAGGPVTLNGSRYIGLPFAHNPANPLLPLVLFQPIAGVGGVNYFEITLLNPPAGFLLDANGIDGTADNTVRFSNFQVMGKIFDDGPNQAPTALPDIAGTAPGTPVLIDVVANDVDVPGPGNVHGIHPQAIALVHPQTGALVIIQGTDGLAGVPTAAGGRVRRVTNLQTGKTTFQYTPPAGLIGSDTFQYVVQDRGGLISQPATVSVTAENLQVDRAGLRARVGKWDVAGTTTAALANTVTLTAGPSAYLNGANEVPPAASEARGEASVRVGTDIMEFALRIDPLPVSAVTSVQIHAGVPGENGPILFFLHRVQVNGAFTGSLTGVLQSRDLLPRPERGISTFAAAVDAIARGEAYVNVLTVGRPAGETRGPFVRPLIGAAPVQPDGNWRFQGKSRVSPGLLPVINAESANGVRILGIPLKLR
jgi:hypothetical protein